MEFSTADLTVEPIELTAKRQTGQADSQVMTEPAIKRKATLAPGTMPDAPKKK